MSRLASPVIYEEDSRAEVNRQNTRGRIATRRSAKELKKHAKSRRGSKPRSTWNRVKCQSWFTRRMPLNEGDV
jgi:hypothetical protein